MNGSSRTIRLRGAVRPSRRRPQADQDRSARAPALAEVQDESDHRSEHGPDQWVRHAEEIKPDAGGATVDRIDQRLRPRLPADASARLVKGLRRDGELAMSESAQSAGRGSPALSSMKMTIASTSPAVPSRPTIGRATRSLRNRRRARKSPRRAASVFQRVHPVFPSRCDLFDRRLQFLDRPAFTRAAHVGDFMQDVDPVAGKVLSQIVRLPRDPSRQDRGA